MKRPTKLRTLCNLVIRHIRRFPYVRQNWVVTNYPDCKTAACLAGHTALALLAPKAPRRLWYKRLYNGDNRNPLDLAEQAFEGAGLNNPGRFFHATTHYWPAEARVLYLSGRQAAGAIKLLQMIRDGKVT